MGVKHLSKGCIHESGGEIGTLPRYPAQRPKIDVSVRDIREASRAAWQAMQQANDPPQFFSFGGTATQVKGSATLQAELEVLSGNGKKMLHLIGETAEWIKPFVMLGDPPRKAKVRLGRPRK